MERKSLIQMARGGFIEIFDAEMSKVLDNILDPNTKATGKRKLRARQIVKEYLGKELGELVEKGKVSIAL